jgi:hypothetical protein
MLIQSSLSNAASNYGYYNYDGPSMILGTLFLESGIALVISGIIVWSSGKKQYIRHVEQERKVNLSSWSLSPSRNGLRLVFQF